MTGSFRSSAIFYNSFRRMSVSSSINQWASEVAQLYLLFCDPMDYSLPSTSIHGIFQARVLECVAISFPRGSSQPRDQTQVSCIAGRCFTVWVVRRNLPVKPSSPPFSLKIRNKIKVPNQTTSIQHSFGNTSNINQRRKKNEWDPNWKKS